MRKLLIKGTPIIIVIPALAQKVGTMEAIFLQQTHYWLETSGHDIGGRKWVYNTYKQWQNQLSLWSESTIIRAIKSLEEQGLIITGNFNRLKLDKTKWYTINYEKLAEIESIGELSTAHAEVSNYSVTEPETLKVTKAIPEITTKITAEKRYIPFSEIVLYLNEKTNAIYRPGLKKTRDLITARWHEGFRLEDFKRVIDQKADEWLHDSKWSRFLRPETLFGTKFESYLNQKSVKSSFREEDFNLED